MNPEKELGDAILNATLLGRSLSFARSFPKNKPTIIAKMKFPVIPVITLLLGLGLGFLISRGASGSGDDPNSVTAIDERETRRDRSRRTGNPAAPSRAVMSLPHRSTPSDGLAALLEITGRNHGSLPTREFYETIEALDESSLASVLEELADVFVNTDPRYYLLSNALYTRFARIAPDRAWNAALAVDHHMIRHNAINSVMAEVALTDPLLAKEMLGTLNDQQAKQSAINAFVTNASSTDPDGVFDLLKDGSSHAPLHQQHLFHGLFHTWATEDPEAAMARLREVRNPQARQYALRAIASALTGTDPGSAMDFANGIENAMERSQVMSSIAGTLMQTDPEGAVALLDGMPAGQARTQTLSAISTAWFQRDPDRAMAWIETLPRNEQVQAVSNGIHQLIYSNAEKAADLLMKMPPSNHLSHHYSTTASHWVQVDPAAAKAWVEGLPSGRARQQAFNGLIQSLSQSDPRAAAAMMESEGIHGQSSYQVGFITSNWIQQDPSAAVAWMEGLDLQGDARRNALNSTLSSWAQHDPEGAAAYAARLENGGDREHAIQSLIGGWSNSDPTAAEAWIKGSLDGIERDNALGTLIGTVAHQDAERALSVFEQATEGLSAEEVSKRFGNALQQISGSWAHYDPEGAGIWLSEQAEGDQRSNAMQNLVDTWADYDLGGAAEFVQTLPQGTERDGVVSRLISDMRNSHPEEALAWAESISGEAHRISSIRSVANAWKTRDPDAARAAIQATNLPDEAKENILRNMEN